MPGRRKGFRAEEEEAGNQRKEIDQFWSNPCNVILVFEKGKPYAHLNLQIDLAKFAVFNHTKMQTGTSTLRPKTVYHVGHHKLYELFMILLHSWPRE